MRRMLFSLLASALLGALAMEAQDGSLSSAGRKYFTDVHLFTHDGKQVALYSDLLRGKVVIINAFFSMCTDSCPRMAGALDTLQERLGDRLGKEVFILSFSVDPENDTPQKLKAYAERFHAKPGWLFLTGTKANVDFALARLGQKVARREDHLTLFMIGNEPTGLWTKVLPSSSADSVMQTVNCIASNNKNGCLREKN